MAKKQVKHPAHHAAGKEDDLSINISSKFKLSKVHWGIAAVVVALLLIIAIASYVKSQKDPVLATVNGEAITGSQVNTLKTFLDASIKSTISDKQLVNDTLVAQVLLLQEAKKNGITRTTQDAEAFIADTISKTGSTKEAFDANLKKTGITHEQFVEFVRSQLIIEDLKTGLFTAAKITVTDAEVQDFYDKNKAQVPPTVTVDQAKATIASYILKQKQDYLLLKYVESLRSKAVIVIK